MNKIFSIILLVFIYINPAFSQDKTGKGIAFETSGFDAAMAKAKSQNKPLFVHAYASWCHYCTHMADSVYTDAEVARVFNSKFISVKMDMEKEGREMNKKLRIHNYPTMLYYSPEGELMHRVSGNKTKYELIKQSEDALDASKQLRTYELKYKSKTLTPEEAYTFFRMVQQAGMDNQPGISNYLMQFNDDQLVEVPQWRILNEQFRDVEQPLMMRFLSLRQRFVEKYTKDTVDNRILNNYNSALMVKVQRLDTAGYNNLIGKLRKSQLDLSDKIIAYAELNKLKLSSKWKEYLEAAPEFISKHADNDVRRLNEVAYNFYERATTPEQLAMAETWSRKAVSMVDNVRYNHTLAGLLYKQKKKEEALKVAQHAIAIAKKEGQDYKQTDLLLDKINELP